MCPASTSTTTPSGTRAPLTMTFRSGPSLLCRWLYLLFLKFQSHSYFVTSSSSFRRSTFQILLSRACFWFRDGVEVRLTFLNEGRERFFRFGRADSNGEFLILELYRALE